MFREILERNRTFAEAFQFGGLPAPPAERLAVITCMDARILPLGVFGLEAGNAHIIRNAGGRVTGDVLRSLAVSTHVLGVRYVAVVHHTECGMARATEEELRRVVREATGADTDDVEFGTIADLRQSVLHDVELVRRSPMLSDDLLVAGFLYDVRTGLLEPLTPLD